MRSSSTVNGLYSLAHLKKPVQSVFFCQTNRSLVCQGLVRKWHYKEWRIVIKVVIENGHDMLMFYACHEADLTREPASLIHSVTVLQCDLDLIELVISDEHYPHAPEPHNTLDPESSINEVADVDPIIAFILRIVGSSVRHGNSYNLRLLSRVSTSVSTTCFSSFSEIPRISCSAMPMCGMYFSM